MWGLKILSPSANQWRGARRYKIFNRAHKFTLLRIPTMKYAQHYNVLACVCKFMCSVLDLVAARNARGRDRHLSTVALLGKIPHYGYRVCNRDESFIARERRRCKPVHGRHLLLMREAGRRRIPPQRSIYGTKTPQGGWQKERETIIHPFRCNASALQRRFCVVHSCRRMDFSLEYPQ